VPHSENLAKRRSVIALSSKLRLAKADQIEQVGSVTSVHTQLLRDTGIKARHERGSVTLRQSELKKNGKFLSFFCFIKIFALSLSYKPKAIVI
jgi:hypothetical protein